MNSSLLITGFPLFTVVSFVQKGWPGVSGVVFRQHVARVEGTRGPLTLRLSSHGSVSGTEPTQPLG